MNYTRGTGAAACPSWVFRIWIVLSRARVGTADMVISRVRKLLMEAAMLLFLLTVSPVYAIAELESGNMRRRPAQVQMVSIRSRRRALDRRMNPYVPIGYYDPIFSRQIYYGSWKDHVLA